MRTRRNAREKGFALLYALILMFIIFIVIGAAFDMAHSAIKQLGVERRALTEKAKAVRLEPAQEEPFQPAKKTP